MQKRSPCSRHVKTRLKFAAIIRTKKQFLEENCGQMKQKKKNCLATGCRNMFGGERAKPLIPRTPYPALHGQPTQVN